MLYLISFALFAGFIATMTRSDSRVRASSAYQQIQPEIAIFRIAGNVSGNVSSAQPPTGGARVRPIPPRIASIVDIACGRADVDPYVTAVSPAQLLQPCANAAKRACPSGSSAAKPLSMPMRRIRSPCCARAAIGHAAAAPPSNVMNSRRHSITSSARASSVGGTSRPSALAVFRLMTNSNLVDCKTGRSAGLAPLRI